jgi:hypothetical protein
MVLTAGVLAVTGLGLLGGAPAGASAAASSAAQHVKAGSKWTFEITGQGCEVQTFGSGKTWTADMGGDGGKYRGGAATIKDVWTTGSDAPAIFKGTYTSAAKAYEGTWIDSSGSLAAELVRGDVGGC